MQDFEIFPVQLPSVELYYVPVSPLLQSIKATLDDSTTLWHFSHSALCCVISKFVEGAFCSIMQIINKDAEYEIEPFINPWLAADFQLEFCLDF